MGGTTTYSRGFAQPSRPARLAFVAALIAAFVLTAPLAADGVSEPVKIGTLSRFPSDVAKRLGIKSMKEGSIIGPNGAAIISAELDRLYQLWNFEFHGKIGTGLIVAERHLGSLELLRVTKIADRLATYSNNGQTGTEYVHTVDTRNHRLFIEFGKADFAPQDRGIVSLDLRTFKHVVKAFPAAVVRPNYKTQAVYGLEYDEREDVLITELVAFDENFQTVAPIVDVIGWPGSVFAQDGALPGPPTMMGPRILRACRQNPISTIQSTKSGPIMIADGPDLASSEVPQPTKTWVVIPCLTTPYSVNTALVRMERSTLFSPNGAEQTIPAPSGIANWVKDDKHGRLHLLNAFRETDDWVYEVASNAFIGLIELSPKGFLASKAIGLGVDSLNGRLYAFGLHLNAKRDKAVSSLMVSEAAQDPVPQVDIFDVGGVDDADANLIVDGKRNRVMLIRRTDPGAAVPESWAPEYEIYAVPPPLPQNEDEDPDSRTQQVQESADKTTAEYGGTATAYGARLLLAAGFTGTVPSNGNDSVGTAYKDVGVQCGLRDREMVLGGFTESSLASGAEPDALAEAVHLDQGTVQDFGKPSRCDLYYQYVGPVYNVGLEEIRKPFYFTSLMRVLDDRIDAAAAEQMCKQYVNDPRCTSSWSDRVDTTAGPSTEWQYTPAECTSKDGLDNVGNNAKYFRGDTRVDCKSDTHVTARAEGRADGVIGTEAFPVALRIGRAVSSTDVKLDPKRGLVSVATSRVENIVVGPITIGFIENKAEAFAKGRMGTAKTLPYEPQIGLVKGPGFTMCEVRCDLNAVIPHLNNTLAGRAEFRTLTPDARLKAGSPGGYEAGIIKSEKQSSSDNALVGDKSREVPALEIILYNDNPRIGRARQVIQLAGVRADAHYGIQVFDEGTPCGADCEPPVIVDPPEPQIVDRVVTVEGPGRTRTVVQPGRIRYAIPGGYRVLMANPRAAGGMLTVWLLLAAPFVIAARRRRLAGLD